MAENLEKTSAYRRKILYWKIVVGGIVFIGVILWVASVLDWERVWRTLKQVNYPLAAISILPVIASHWLRAIRWKTMLSSVRQLKSVPVLDLFSAVMVGYTANNIIPRSGEILRPLIVSKRHGISVWSLIASVLTERVIDVVQLLFFLGIGLLVLPDIVTTALPPWIIEEESRLLALILFVSLVAIAVVGFTSFGEWIAVNVLRSIRPNIAMRIRALFEAWRQGIRVVNSARDVVIITMQSACIWLMYALPLWIVLGAVPMPSAAMHTWSFGDACVILLVVAVATTIAPTPGAIGVVHAFAAEAMQRLYGITLEEGFVFITVAHALNYISVMLVGGICAAREGMSFSAMMHPPPSSEIVQTAIE